MRTDRHNNGIRALTLTEEAILEFGKKLIVEAPDKLYTFAKFLTTLTVALLPTYFTVIKYLNIPFDALCMSLSIVFVIFQLLTIILSLLTLMPQRGRVVLEDIDALRRDRETMLRRKYGYVYAACSIFVISLCIMTSNILVHLNCT